MGPQGIGSDLLVLPPGLPRNMAIVPRVPEIAVTASRTVEHALAMRALATRTSVTSFRLVRCCVIACEADNSQEGHLRAR